MVFLHFRSRLRFVGLQRLRNCRSKSSNVSPRSALTSIFVDKPLGTRKSPPLEVEDQRKTIAPWLRIGEFNPNLLSHMSMFQIFRSLGVLHLCSYDFIVDRSQELFHLAQKFAALGSRWALRKTFFDQFVGGENVTDIMKVMRSMQKRGLTIMMVSVLEEDVEDEPVEEKVYDENLKRMLDLMDLISSVEKNKPILQLKPTTLMPAQTLETIAASINNYCSISETSKLSGLIEQVSISIQNPSRFPLKVAKMDEIKFIDGLKRADALVRKAKEKQVHILVDAEFHSCKPSISMIAQSLMARHNQDGHWIGNTIQGYLKEAVPTIQSELEALTINLGVNWFGKIVRGAYLDRERQLANKRGLVSPTWSTYDETSESYNKVVGTVLEHLAHQNLKTPSATSASSSHLVVASHNELSIRLAAQRMKELGIERDSNQVSFAQIYGMADYLSTPLVTEGYRVYKSTPYGPMDEVFPYLARRASENRSVVKGAREERGMLRKELARRLRLL